MVSSIRTDFAELYRSAFAETDPQLKQMLLQQVQSLIDTWHVEQQQNYSVVVSAAARPWQRRRIAS